MPLPRTQHAITHSSNIEDTSILIMHFYVQISVNVLQNMKNSCPSILLIRTQFKCVTPVNCSSVVHLILFKCVIQRKTCANLIHLRWKCIRNNQLSMVHLTLFKRVTHGCTIFNSSSGNTLFLGWHIWTVVNLWRFFIFSNGYIRDRETHIFLFLN